VIECLAREDTVQLCFCFSRESMYKFFEFAFNEEWVESGLPVAIVIED